MADNIKAQIKEELFASLQHLGYSFELLTSLNEPLGFLVDEVFTVIENSGYVMLPKNLSVSAAHLQYFQNVVATNTILNQDKKESSSELEVFSDNVQALQILYTLGQTGWVIIPPL